MSEFGGSGSFDLGDEEREIEPMEIVEAPEGEPQEFGDLVIEADGTKQYDGDHIVNQILEIPEEASEDSNIVNQILEVPQEATEDANIDNAIQEAPEQEASEAASIENQIQEVSGREASEGTSAVNQILETPDEMSLEAMQSTVDTLLSMTIEQIFSENGEYIPVSQQEVASRVESVILTEQDGSGILGEFVGPKGEAGGYIDVQQTQNVSQLAATVEHEGLHAASFDRSIVVPQPERGGYTVYATNGLSRSETFYSADGAKTISTRGIGIDEGFTEHLAVDQLGRLNGELGAIAARETAYPGTTELCAEAARLVGLDAFKDAYFGGNHQGLQESFDQLGGEYAYELFCEALDKTIDYEHPDLQAEGFREALSILTHMQDAKEGE